MTIWKIVFTTNATLMFYTQLERYADQKIVNSVSRMLEKEYGLIHNKDYHMTFVFVAEKPASLRIKILDTMHQSSKDSLLISIRKIYDHSTIL